MDIAPSLGARSLSLRRVRRVTEDLQGDDICVPPSLSSPEVQPAGELRESSNSYRNEDQKLKFCNCIFRMIYFTTMIDKTHKIACGEGSMACTGDRQTDEKMGTPRQNHPPPLIRSTRQLNPG